MTGAGLPGEERPAGEHALLDSCHLLRRNVETDVAAAEDDAVGLVRNAVELGQRCAVLHLGAGYDKSARNADHCL